MALFWDALVLAVPASFRARAHPTLRAVFIKQIETLSSTQQSTRKVRVGGANKSSSDFQHGGGQTLADAWAPSLLRRSIYDLAPSHPLSAWFSSSSLSPAAFCSRSRFPSTWSPVSCSRQARQAGVEERVDLGGVSGRREKPKLPKRRQSRQSRQQTG